MKQCRQRMAFVVLVLGMFAGTRAVLVPWDARADWWVNTGNTGNWNDGVNWNAGNPPPVGGVGEVILNGTAIISASPLNQPLNDIWCGNNGLGNNRIVMQTGSVAINYWLVIGRLWDSGSTSKNMNIFNLNNGAVSGGFNSEIGWQNGSGGTSVGILSISNDATYVSGGFFHLGSNYSGGNGGTGIVYLADNGQLIWGQSGNGANIGLSPGSAGIVYQSGNSLARHRYSGGNGWWVNLGADPGAYGEYNLQGGTMEMYTGDVYQWTGDGFNVGSAGTGVFNVSGGTAHLRDLLVGKWNTGVGTVNQSGGVVDAGIFVGAHGDARIGGFDGGSAGAQGTYNLSDGSLTIAQNFQVGSYGTGTFNQTGGAHTNRSWMAIGRFAGSVGVYNLSGGTLNKTSEGGNALIVGEDGNGTLNISGSGKLNVSGWDLIVGGTASASGKVKITGSAATINVARDINLRNNPSANTELEVVADAVGLAPINVANNVSLNNCKLTANLTAMPPSPYVTLINNAGSNPVGGTFNGLAEGALVPNAKGRTITYVGGTGNDVVLVQKSLGTLISVF